ncbi:hypothetical protein ACEZDB_30190 [Streptacidiphilus sp. N1-3]|uniref:Prevent-host-death family protein n=1 Tax=Streptacidiphilus alkalitolerans TaxID=3342712 RepID=A0ABV6X9E6_9ACTN
MSAQTEVNFSELINKPKDTLARLDRTRRILLRRRDAEDLVLTTVARAEQDSTVVSAATRLFAALMQQGPAPRELLLQVLPAAFPWVKYLPREDREAFARQLFKELTASESLESSAPVAQLIIAWQHTAEVHADPELFAVLTSDSGDDYGPVPAPGAER